MVIKRPGKTKEPDTPETIATKLKMLTLSMGGTVKDGSG